MDALWYLYRCQWRNFLRTAVRSPRRLLSLVILVLWLLGMAGQMVLVLFLDLDRTSSHWRLEIIRGGSFGALLLLTLGSLYVALEGGLFVFPLAEVDFVFSSPVPRRWVLLSKLARDYLRILVFSSFYLAILAPVLLTTVGVPHPGWIAFYGIGLTALGIGLVHCVHGVGLLSLYRWPALYQQRRWIGSALIIAVLLGLLIWMWREVGSLRLIGRQWPLALQFFNQPALGWFFPPVAWMADLVLTPWLGWTPGQWARLAGLVLFALLTGGALLGQRANIYEAALGPSLYFGRIREAVRTGGWMAAQAERQRLRPGNGGVQFVLPPFGRGAPAVFWKQWVTSFHYPVRMLSVAVLFGVLIPMIFHRLTHHLQGSSDAGVVPVLVSIAYLQFMWFFSFAFYSYWQSFWRHTEWLKPVPIAGWRMLLAYALPPVVNATALISLSTAMLMALDPVYRASSLTLVWSSTPSLLLLLSLALCFVAFLFPHQEWSQSMLAGLIMFLVAGFALTPALVAGFTLLRWHTPTALAAAVVSLLNGALIGLALIAGHRLYERWEPSEE